MKHLLLDRGLLLLEDALHLKSVSVPMAAESGHWNLVVYVSFTAIELLLKSVSCLAGYTPRENHEAASMLTRLTRQLTKSKKAPVILTVNTTGPHSYRVWSDGRLVHLYRYTAGVRTQLGPTRMLPAPAFYRASLALRIDGHAVSVLSRDKVILSVVDIQAHPFRRETRHFQPPDSLALVQALLPEIATLRRMRESALYGTERFTEKTARRATNTLDASFVLVDAMLPQPSHAA